MEQAKSRSLYLDVFFMLKPPELGATAHRMYRSGSVRTLQGGGGQATRTGPGEKFQIFIAVQVNPAKALEFTMIFLVSFPNMQVMSMFGFEETPVGTRE